MAPVWKDQEARNEELPAPRACLHVARCHAGAEFVQVSARYYCYGDVHRAVYLSLELFRQPSFALSGASVQTL